MLGGDDCTECWVLLSAWVTLVVAWVSIGLSSCILFIFLGGDGEVSLTRFTEDV